MQNENKQQVHEPQSRQLNPKYTFRVNDLAKKSFADECAEMMIPFMLTVDNLVSVTINFAIFKVTIFMFDPEKEAFHH